VLKKYTFIIFIALIMLVSNAQEEGWSSQEDIQKKTPDGIIGDYENAQQNWDTLSKEQKDAVYARAEGLKAFSQEFALEKGLKGLDASLGQAAYDKASNTLKNGNTNIEIGLLKGAEVKALEGGGFEVKFPDKEEPIDLTSLKFEGGTNGITFGGNNLKFKESTLTSGKVTILNENHVRIEKYSVFETKNLRFTTPAQEFDLFYGTSSYNKNYIRIDTDELEIEGDDLKVEFLKKNQFRIVSIDGEITLIDGGLVFEFDGNGNSYEKIPLGEPLTEIEIEDENAPEKKYALNPEDESKLDKASLEGNVCSISGITGDSITDISGKVSQSICKGPLVQTGTSLKENKYEVNLDMNKEHVEKVKTEFIKKFGREPNLYSDQDLKELSNIINDKVTELKFTQKFLEDNTYPRWIVNRAIRGWVDAGLDSKTLTPAENTEIDAIVDIVTHIKQGQNLKFEVSGDEGRVIYTTEGGLEKKIPVFSGRLTKAYIRNYYDRNINVPEESRDLLKTYFGKKEIALK